jgi:two-component system, chemotaxis family, protein-glutamate methylesterase/glutaminase
MSIAHTVRTLIVDDSSVYRHLISNAVKSIDGMRVAGFATNGKEALDLVESLRPDLVTLDVEMPVMNGIDALKEIKLRFPTVQVIMVSSLTRFGAELTIEALQLGALDFITKPDSGTPEENTNALQSQLKPKLAFWQEKAKDSTPKFSIHTEVLKTGASSTTASIIPPQILAIGASTGGPKALAQVLSQLNHRINIPIVIVQHMPKLFTKSLAQSLDSKCSLLVKEGEDGELLQKNTVYLAPGGAQMQLESGDATTLSTQSGKRYQDTIEARIQITDDPPELFCKPSVNYLFRSVAQVYKEAAIGVILTGMGSDGAKGLKLMKRQGARTIGQDEASCVVYGMPGEAYKVGAVDVQCGLEDIGNLIMKMV